MALDYDTLREVHDPRLHCPRAYSRQVSSQPGGRAPIIVTRHLFHEWRPFEVSGGGGATRAMCIHCRGIGEIAASPSMVSLVRDD